MMTLKDLQQKLKMLEKAEAEIRGQGIFLINPDFGLDSTRNGRGTERIYYRKRWFDAKGKRQSQPLNYDEYTSIKAEIERGAKLEKINAEKKEIQIQIEYIAKIAEQFGLDLPRMSPAENARQVKHSSDSNEWYTPEKFIEMARRVMGKIDLDPASSPVAQGIVQAKHYFTQAEDGMQQNWWGRVWLNPPYGRCSNELNIYGATAWMQKAITEFESGRVDQAILLVRVSGSRGVRELESKFPRCSVGRIPFISPVSKNCDRPGHDSLFFYLGSEVEKFREVFSEIGSVLGP
ncbi:DNA N-6-adenine-methyltransferase [Pantanalinema rosaneae CENA516]|uniref:DNA N-6-adenine-methyltransferase n=1 Tax=Pantanalinema rosaneae TaxID=1620701 RepID=UPI003D6E1258